MSKPKVATPAQGSRLVTAGDDVVLFGQPPEVLKGLLVNGVTGFETLVLTDVREKDGSCSTTSNSQFISSFSSWMG